MKTDKDILNKDLQDLFKEIPLESPSSDFINNLMVRIEHETVKEKKRSRWITIVSIAAGVLGFLLIPGTVFYLMGFEFASLDMSVIGSEITGFFSGVLSFFQNYSIIILIACTVFLLLMIDILFRSHIFNKKYKVDHC